MSGSAAVVSECPDVCSRPHLESVGERARCSDELPRVGELADGAVVAGQVEVAVVVVDVVRDLSDGGRQRS